MFCRKCGAQIPDGCSFCNKCGTPADGSGMPAAADRMYSDRHYGIFSPAGWFDFSGRMRRLEWWGRSILMYVLIICVMAAAFMAIGAGSRPSTGSSAAAPAGNDLTAGAVIGIIVIVLAAIAFIVSSISLDVRRLHDMELSGWWVLLLRIGSVIPYVGFVVAIGGLIWLGFVHGTRGSNRFGQG